MLFRNLGSLVLIALVHQSAIFLFQDVFQAMFQTVTQFPCCKLQIMAANQQRTKTNHLAQLHKPHPETTEVKLHQNPQLQQMENPLRNSERSGLGHCLHGKINFVTVRWILSWLLICKENTTITTQQ